MLSVTGVVLRWLIKAYFWSQNQKNKIWLQKSHKAFFCSALQFIHWILSQDRVHNISNPAKFVRHRTKEYKIRCLKKVKRHLLRVGQPGLSLCFQVSFILYLCSLLCNLAILLILTSSFALWFYRITSKLRNQGSLGQKWDENAGWGEFNVTSRLWGG